MLTWHIMMKDARRARWPLIAWVAVMAGRYLLGVALLRAPSLDADLLKRLSAHDDWLWLIQAVIAYLLAGWIVQEDLLVGNRASWLTRPISRGRLLGAKLLGVGLFVCVLPALVALPWWLFCGYGLREVAGAAAETIFWFAVLSTVAMALAGLTDDLARFVLYSVILILVAGTYALVLISARASGFDRFFGALGGGVGASRAWISALWVLFIGVTTAAHQCLSRQTGASWVWLAIGLVGLIVPVHVWRWDVSDWLQARAPAVPEVGGISAEFVGAQLTPGTRAVGHSRLEISMLVKGAPAKTFLSVRRLDYSWRWADGVRYGGYQTVPSSFVVYASRDKELWWEVLGLRESQLWNYAANRAWWEWFLAKHPRSREEPPDGSWSTELSIPASIGAKMLRQPPAWTATIAGDVSERRLASVLPLRAGAKGGQGRDGLTILALGRSFRDQVTVTVSQSWSTAGSLGVIDPAVVSYAEANDWGWSWGCAAFSADKTREVSAIAAGFFVHRIGTVAVVRRQLALRAPRRWAGNDGQHSNWTIDPEWPGWLEHATLARVVHQPVGRFEQTLHLDRMVVESAKVREPAAAH